MWNDRNSTNGTGEILDLKIDDSLMDDKDSLQILLNWSYNDIIKMIEENKKSSILGMAKDLNMGL